MKLRYLLLSLIVCINILLPSIFSDTLIKTTSDYKTIENITIGDSLVSYDNNHTCTSTVSHISKAFTDILVIITTKKGKISVCPDQQFFDPILQQWIAAKDLTTQNVFLNAQLNYCACLEVEIIDAPETTIYQLSTTAPHNFFATEQEVLLHNIAPLIIGFGWAFGSGLQFAGITIGTAILGSYVGIKLYNKHKQKDKEFDIILQTASSGYAPDPDDDDKNDERKFNTISKAEFFKKVKNDYEHYKNGIYRRKKGAKGIQKAEYLQWDHLHGDVEAYAKGGKHLGSIDPQTLKIYKNPQIRTIRF